MHIAQASESQIAERAGLHPSAVVADVSETGAEHPETSPAFLSALQSHALPGFRTGMVRHEGSGGWQAQAPTFRYDFRLDMPLGPRVQRIGDWLLRVAPQYLRVPLLCLGSPMSDHCGLSLPPGAAPGERRDLFAGLLQQMMATAEAEGSDVLAVKDLPDQLARELDPVLIEHGYTRLASLPIAMLDLPFDSEEAYLDSLRSSVRADLRRKMRQASDVRLIVHRTSDSPAMEQKLEALYAATRARSKVDYGGFDDLPAGFLWAMLRAMGSRARLVTSWVGDRLAGFNVFLIGDERAIAYKIGLDSELARRHNLYFVNWMWMVRYAIENRLALVEMGQTTYALKQRLGCRLEPSWIYVRHRRSGWNRLFKFAVPRVSIARMDPDLAT